MEAESTDERLQLQHLAGGEIISNPPVYAPTGEHLFVISGQHVQVYSTTTGELIRKLIATGSSHKLIAMELEIGRDDILLACSSIGEVFRWKWRTGRLEDKKQLNLPESEIKTFNLLNYFGNSTSPYAFVTIKTKSNPIHWAVMNIENGCKVQVPLIMRLTYKPVMVAVGRKNFKYIAVAQGHYVYFVDYKSWVYRRLKNAHNVPITVVRFHPSEELVATGDELGKIFLWRQFMDKATVVTSLYHWHHTSITSLAFSASGASFYSSGLEAVLVKWNTTLNQKTFVPRICSIVRHIAVNEDNTQVAVCTADNGVHIVGNDNRMKITLQQFTYVKDDNTGKSKFPVGLRLNPRTNTLVLNGRVGHLQFYSAYTKNLLYNMDIVDQNRLSEEAGKILYDIRVTKAAFNLDWMATGEVFNDEQHLPELRLKFWKYDHENQSYMLNTNIEIPHEGGFKAIEFSSDYQVENLLCATVGEDNVLKVWSLDETDNIYKQGKVWYCIARTTYKNMPVDSISFSQDGSLLAAGFGNTLCIYKADTLKLKATLTSSPGYDGSVAKAQVCIPKQKVNGSKNEIAERRKRILQLFVNMLESNEPSLIKEIQKQQQQQLNCKSRTPKESLPLDNLDDKQKLALFKKVQEMHELNLYQKLLLYQKLNIQCEVPQKWQSKMADYLRRTVAQVGMQERHKNLQARLTRLNMRDRFKAKYRLKEFQQRKRNYDGEINKNLIPIMSVLNLSDNVTSSRKHLPNGNHKEEDDSKKKRVQVFRPPRVEPAEIRQVQFASNEFAHLVVVCTASRVLIWNLMTLRLQSSLKMSVKHMAFDPQSNLIAAFTHRNDLHIFQPNVPLPIYQRANMPNVHGAVWLPRRHPKARSLHVDWQAQSTLYFLTESQEIMFLGTADDLASDAPPPIEFTNDEAPEAGIRYGTFGAYATQRYSDKQSMVARQNGPLILHDTSKAAVKSLIEMTTHTMPPLNILCNEFVKTLVKPAETLLKKEHSRRSANGGNNLMNGYANEDDNDDDNEMQIDHNEDDDDDDDLQPGLSNGHETRPSSAKAKEDAKLHTSKSSNPDALRTRQEILVKSEELKQQKQRQQLNQEPRESMEASLRRIATTQAIELEL